MGLLKVAVITVVVGVIPMMLTSETSIAAERDADEVALKQRTAAFVEAVNMGDAKQVAEFWTDEGEYTSGDGVAIRGKVDLQHAYQVHFKKIGVPKVSHDIDGVRFLSRDVAKVEGGFESNPPNETEVRLAGFSMLYVRQDDVWRIASLQEWSRATTLRDLDWLIGEWTAKTATNTLTPKGGDTFRFRSTSRTLNGKALPDVGPITVKRAK